MRTKDFWIACTEFAGDGADASVTLHLSDGSLMHGIVRAQGSYNKKTPPRAAWFTREVATRNIDIAVSIDHVIAVMPVLLDRTKQQSQDS